MNTTDIQIAICGSAGEGTIAAGDILRSALAGAGYRIIAFDAYPAEIRGFGKCVARLRATTEQTYSLKDKSDILVCLNDEHGIPHLGEARDYGAVIYEANSVVPLAEGAHVSAHIRPGQIPYPVQMRELSENATGSNRSRNMVVIGFIAGLYGIEREAFYRIIDTKFRKKPGVAELNHKAFDAGYAEGSATFRLDDVAFGPPGAKLDAVMLNGNAAVVKGCLDAGIDSFFGYPITPATTIMERLAIEMPKRGKRLLQTEDEIAAVAAAIGAGYTGARAATATSGPGLALMSEMLGLAVMAEVPCVIFVSQRGGPATGIPTKTEQADLNIALYGGHGDAPRIVLAPSNVEGCYRCAGAAFEMAERYQTPVIVLLDLYLSNRYETVLIPPASPFAADSDKPLNKDDLQPGYKRFALTDDFVSPRALPGMAGGMHVVTGLEHNELGRVNEQPEVHEAMSRKRHEKLKAALNHPDLWAFRRYGDAGAVQVGLLAWGSTFGECLEVISRAQRDGIRCAALKVRMLHPFPVEAVTEFIDGCDVVLVPELNYQGQFARLVQAETCRKVVRYNRVTGTPLRVDDIYAQVRSLVEARRQVA
ncbi:MAG: 2-oxoacid:acceptor oxidoreductase subunit alpha [Rhodocyclaceae bacterium]|nr:2-oxoacid:acceptor oxidoreductase subunit alpha [Rhodocyclaceae bacterium]MBX3668341.1 2-oxoacid:acceptor oxidoreductase subunit alpha [Rhodocyclaceae bacterium]